MDHAANRDAPSGPPESEPVTAARRGTTCTTCGYDLTDQRVVNESHYRINIVACPECGGVQPYGPRFRGRRSERRRASVVSFAWLALAILLVLGVGGALMALAQSTEYAATIPFAESLSREYIPSDHPIVGPSGDVWDAERDRESMWEFVSADWWHDNRHEFVAAHGGWASLADWIVLTDLLYYIPICIGLGVFWRALFMHAHLVTNAVAILMSMLFGALLLSVYFDVIEIQWLGYHRPAIHAAEDVVGWPIAWISYAVGCASFLAALPVSGVLLRLLFRHLAPPSIRAKLWRFDPASAPTR